MDSSVASSHLLSNVACTSRRKRHDLVSCSRSSACPSSASNAKITRPLALSSSFVRNEFRAAALRCSRARCSSVRPNDRRKKPGFGVVSEMAGNYEESFHDIDKHMLDCFTIKAIKTLLAQLSELNPPTYAWFYDFVANNKPKDSKVFLRALVKERQDLAERVMITRVDLFNKWAKRYDHVDMHKMISDQNLELLRERLAQTVVFATEDVEPSAESSS